MPSIDAGGIRFCFFLPDEQVALGQSVPVATIGVRITSRIAGRHPVHLHGSAAEVVVALSETAPAWPASVAHPHSVLLAIRAPSRSASNFAQITVGCTSGR